MTSLTRRHLLGLLGTAGAATIIPTPGAHAQPHPGAIPFFGPHQAGIAEPPQANLQFAALRVKIDSRAELRTLLADWTSAAAALTRGLPVGRATTGPDAVPIDTGEALDLPPAALTLTFGFGPSLFRDARGRDRFGIAAQQPRTLVPIPAFPGDALDPQKVGGDLCIQACADDPQVAMHAVRNLLRIAGDRVTVAWTQSGFNRAAALASVPTTPRNLFGFRDGTNNIGSPADLDAFVWARPEDSPWLAGGTTLVVRRIRMFLSPWDAETLQAQEEVFGRTKGDGAPLSGGSERTPPDFTVRDDAGLPRIPVDSHVALAHPSRNAGARILRRAFNYADATDPDGTPDAGLFFMSYQRDLARQYIPMQRRLAESDLLNEYIRHTASAAFVIPPGVHRPGDVIGGTLLD
jgi:deferrochelatase/peroxidase EfeB